MGMKMKRLLGNLWQLEGKQEQMVANKWTGSFI